MPKIFPHFLLKLFWFFCFTFKSVINFELIFVKAHGLGQSSKMAHKTLPRDVLCNEFLPLEGGQDQYICNYPGWT